MKTYIKKNTSEGRADHETDSNQSFQCTLRLRCQENKFKFMIEVFLQQVPNYCPTEMFDFCGIRRFSSQTKQSTLADPGRPPPPNRINCFHFRIHFHRKVYVSEVGAPPNGSVPPQREILDLPLVNEIYDQNWVKGIGYEVYVVHRQDRLLSCQLCPAFPPGWKENEYRS